MNRRQVITAMLATVGVQAATAMPALAATFVEQVVTQLRAQGFDDIEVERTMLGRTRIAAERLDGSREIVLNPTTGEILRDLWTSKSGETSGQINIGDDSNSGSGSGTGSDDDNDDDDGGSGEGDNSGSGGGSGGGSGSGSGSGDDGDKDD